MEEQSESEALQDNLGYEIEDLNAPLSELEKFLEYHEIDEQDYAMLSNNQKKNYWWNYRRFGK